MTNHAGRRRRALSLMATGLALAGCSGAIGTKQSAQVRSIDVATNTINSPNNTDTTVVLVNGAADAVSVPYGITSAYLYLQSGTSSFAGGFPGAQPELVDPAVAGGLITVTQPTVTVGTTTTLVEPQPSTYVLATNQKYTAYLCGCTDVTNPTQADLSDLDPRYLRVAVLQDNQPAPPSGSAIVRVLVSAPDAGAVDVFANGAGSPQFADVGYAPYSSPQSSANVTLPAGTTTFQANVSGTSTVLVPSITMTLAAGADYTLVVGEPTSLPVPIEPHTPPSSATYALTLVQN